MMQIQINAPGIDVPAPFRQFMEERIPEVLGASSKRMTRVEVHLKDLNADKGGLDKRCVLEARPSGLEPIAVDAIASEAHEAFRQALNKLRDALDRRFGRMDTHRRSS